MDRLSQGQWEEYYGNLFEAYEKARAEGQPKQAPPDVLFHLTGADALSKILSTRSLWASHVSSMNDSLEIQHAVNMAIQVIDERLSADRSDYMTALRRFLLDPSSIPEGPRLGLDHFVVSFCERPRKSHQWLNYGHQGSGVAIGFSRQIEQAVGYDLVRVDYDEESQKRRIRLVVDAGASALKAWSLAQVNQRPVADWAATIMATHIRTELAPQFKHRSFDEEDEWRLIGVDPSCRGKSLLHSKGECRPIEFVTEGNRIIPHDTLDFAADRGSLVKEVIIGHASPLSEDAVRLLARENGLNIIVSRSEVPVRPAGHCT